MSGQSRARPDHAQDRRRLLPHRAAPHFVLGQVKHVANASGSRIRRVNMRTREEGERVSECRGERVRRPIEDRAWAAAAPYYV